MSGAMAVAAERARCGRRMVAPGWRWGPLLAVCLAQMLLMLDVTIVIVALPAIASDLSGNLQSMQLIVDAYALALAALLLNTGAIADRFGRRRVFVAGLVPFGLASALCGVANGATFLIAARALQGVGGAMIFATGLAILGAAYVGADRAKVLAVFGAAVALGPLVGGAIIQIADWRWIFLVNLPVITLAIVIALRHVPETRNPRPRRVDWVGQVVFAAGIGSLVTARGVRNVGVVVRDVRLPDPLLPRGRGHRWASRGDPPASGDRARLSRRRGRRTTVVSPRLVLTAALSCTALGLLEMTMLDASSS